MDGEKLCKQPQAPKPATGKLPCDREESKQGLALGGDPSAPGPRLILVFFSSNCRFKSYKPGSLSPRSGPSLHFKGAQHSQQQDLVPQFIH